MTAAAEFAASPVPPELDPQAIRGSLTPTLAAEFDSEWNIALDKAKRTHDLAGVHALLAKWRHIAYGEMVDPGAHYRLLAKAEQILRAGANQDAVPIDHVQALIKDRLGR